eukprot:1152110-Pelagomonas_calceolata.AAC.1
MLARMSEGINDECKLLSNFKQLLKQEKQGGGRNKCWHAQGKALMMTAGSSGSCRHLSKQDKRRCRHDRMLAHIRKGTNDDGRLKR